MLIDSVCSSAEMIQRTQLEAKNSWQACSTLRVANDGSVLSTLGTVACARLNSFLSIKPHLDDLSERLDENIEVWKSLGVPVTWRTPDDEDFRNIGTVLAAKGLLRLKPRNGMAMDLSTLDDETAPRRVRIVEVTSSRQLASFCRVMAAAFDSSAEAESVWREMFESLGYGGGDRWRHFVAMHDGCVAATASVFLGNESSYLSNIGTAPAFRRRGLGLALTRHCLRFCRGEGAKSATLFATEEAAGLYERLGFRSYCRSNRYLWTTRSLGFNPGYKTKHSSLGFQPGNESRPQARSLGYGLGSKIGPRLEA